jgi:hypothetical protein
MALDKTLQGKRVRLLACTDPHTSLRRGDEGTVQFTDDMGTLHVKWDTGSSLGLIRSEGDRWEVINDD